jgi:hypothetical protein
LKSKAKEKLKMSNNTLASGAALVANQSLVSNNGIYILKVTANGFVFLDNQVTGNRLWVQGRLNQVRPVLTMQTTGDLVFTEGNQSTEVWDSGTGGYQGAYAVLCDNGNLVIYDAHGDPIWSLGTAQGPTDAVSTAFREIRASLENALSNLSILEAGVGESNVTLAPKAGEASVNVRGSNASAE